tara:strand:+ start:94 stop:1221 length:1128 start_codon:yes stop_codon:yes gene_type:complete
MELNYITYQGIPSSTAHGIHTFSLIKYFVKNGLDIKLVFPLREKSATTELTKLQNHYEINENFKIEATKHYLPFGRTKFLKKYTYLFSHILWSFYISKKYKKNSKDLVFTLSDWVFYFLSKKNINVTYECHDLTLIRKKLIKKALLFHNSKIICINKFVKEDLGLEESKNVVVLENGFDHEVFSKKIKKESPIRVLFAGNLERFGKTRGIEQIIKYFIKINFSKKVQLHIFGGPTSQVENLRHKYNHESLFIHGHIKRSELSREMAISHIGVLTNIESTHSQRHTSPLKFYEYIGSGLKVLATDALAHKSLPYQDSLYFFDLNNIDSFKNSINLAIENISKNEPLNYEKSTIDFRVKAIIKFISARPEGLEPSTP